MYIPRKAESLLHQLAEGYPVLAVTGPRQSGKTTLTRHAFPNHDYISLEEIDNREYAESDPRGFLAQFSHGVIIDEAQRCPALFSYIQGLADDRQQMGEFILTGSQQFSLLTGITQSLAGRCALVTLLPLELGELRAAEKMPSSLDQLLFMGSYPPLYDRKLDPQQWCGNYVRTYLDRDVRQLVNIQNLSDFQRFMRLCAARTGQILNLSSLGAECGVSHNTIKAWISVLEASFILHLLQPHHKNFNKRLIKSPKLYFLDTGLAAWLMGIQSHEQLAIHPARGALFESWVVSQLLKSRYNRGLEPNLYFWRDRTGHEIDIIIDNGLTLDALEIKSGQTINKDFFKGLNYWSRLIGSEEGAKGGHGLYLVFGGERKQYRSGISVIPWNELDGLTDKA